jgi:hypothetical protein
MVRALGCIVAILISLHLVAQEEMYIRPGLLKASATIAPGKMLNRTVNTIYLSGFLEYHTEKNFSLRGDTYWYIDGVSQKPTDVMLANASRTYFGAFYHVNLKNWDNYIGFQPGISFLRFGAISPKISVCPSFALHVGTTYYVWKYFHFFADIAYVNSIYRGTSNGSMKTDEIIFSAGLGFQLMTKKN